MRHSSASKAAWAGSRARSRPVGRGPGRTAITRCRSTSTTPAGQRLGDPSLVLLEVDDRPALYELGPVPGAWRLEWTEDLQDAVRRDLPDAAAMTRLWERVGVSEGSTVVFYGDLHNWLAAFGLTIAA